MLAKVCSAAVNGIEAYPVEVEVNAGFGDTIIVMLSSILLAGVRRRSCGVAIVVADLIRPIKKPPGAERGRFVDRRLFCGLLLATCRQRDGAEPASRRRPWPLRQPSHRRCWVQERRSVNRSGCRTTNSLRCCWTDCNNPCRLSEQSFRDPHFAV
jgi:hypothetical protein